MTAVYTVVLAEASAEENVQHNHGLFEGKLPAPDLFGLYGRVPLSTVGDEVAQGTKIWPDLANATGRGAHVDFAWKRHGIPSYLTTRMNLNREKLALHHFRIVTMDQATSNGWDPIRVSDLPLEQIVTCICGRNCSPDVEEESKVQP